MLTKAMLVNYGVLSIEKKDDTWVVEKKRLHTNGWGTKGEIYNAPLRYITTKHKYGDPIIYQGVVLNKGVIPLHRIIYAWFKEDIPDGYDIHHLDGNTMNNDPSNLQMITHAENLRRKEVQNNQWTITSTSTKYSEI